MVVAIIYNKLFSKICLNETLKILHLLILLLKEKNYKDKFLDLIQRVSNLFYYTSCFALHGLTRKVILCYHTLYQAKTFESNYI